MFKVGCVFIPVTDLQKSTEWYEAILGVRLIDRWDDGAGFYFPNGSTQLGLVKVESPQPTEFSINRNRKNTYYNFVVDDIEAAHRHLHDRNVTTTSIEDFGGMKGFDFFDLDGNPFSVVNEDSSSPFHTDHVEELQNK